MKKQLLILFTALLMGQFCAAIPENRFSNALKSLRSIGIFFNAEWSPFTKKMDPYHKISFASDVKTITDYAKENSKNSEIIPTAKALCDITEQIIMICKQAESLDTMDITLRENEKNLIIDKIKLLTQELTQVSNTIDKKIFGQKANDALREAMLRQLLILESIKKVITEIK